MILFDYLQSFPLAFYATATVLGLLVGSFLNVVIYRLPIIMERVWRQQCHELLNIPANQDKDEKDKRFDLILPRSHCPHCGHSIKAFENIPVISYFYLGGKCANCKAKIPFRYPAVEISTGILTLIVALHFGFGGPALGAMLITWALIALSVIDFDHQLLPDDITLPFIWLGLAVSLFGYYTSVQSSIIGAIAGYLILWLIYKIFKYFTGKEGMGYGDFKLLALLGAWMGWQMLPVIILLSSLVGAIVGISLIVFRGRDKNSPIPFGPYLATAGWISLLWGEQLTHLYLEISHIK